MQVLWIYCMIYLTISNDVELLTYTVLHISLHTYLYLISKSKYNKSASILIVILENSNKSSPLMVAFHMMTLECSVTSQKIIHSFEIGTC